MWLWDAAKDYKYGSDAKHPKMQMWAWEGVAIRTLNLDCIYFWLHLDFKLVKTTCSIPLDLMKKY